MKLAAVLIIGFLLGSLYGSLVTQALTEPQFRLADHVEFRK